MERNAMYEGLLELHKRWQRDRDLLADALGGQLSDNVTARWLRELEEELGIKAGGRMSVTEPNGPRVARRRRDEVDVDRLAAARAAKMAYHA